MEPIDFALWWDYWPCSCEILGKLWAVLAHVVATKPSTNTLWDQTFFKEIRFIYICNS